MEGYLPVGTVVRLTGGSKTLLIYGRRQADLGTGKTWDYLACPYPEGYLNQQFTYVFNRGQIEAVLFWGFHNAEDAAYTLAGAQNL